MPLGKDYIRQQLEKLKNGGSKNRQEVRDYGGEPLNDPSSRERHATVNSGVLGPIVSNEIKALTLVDSKEIWQEGNSLGALRGTYTTQNEREALLTIVDFIMETYESGVDYTKAAFWLEIREILRVHAIKPKKGVATRYYYDAQTAREQLLARMGMRRIR